MRSTAPLSTGMHIAIPLSGASAADTGRVALPESPCCRGRHDFPDDPLRAAEGRIQALERDLVIARRAVDRAGGAKVDPLYHAVGLHAGAPSFLIVAARRVYRQHLHPDHHPAAHKRAAHERFIAAEEKFKKIYTCRGI